MRTLFPKELYVDIQQGLRYLPDETRRYSELPQGFIDLLDEASNRVSKIIEEEYGKHTEIIPDLQLINESASRFKSKSQNRDIHYHASDVYSFAVCDNLLVNPNTLV